MGEEMTKIIELNHRWEKEEILICLLQKALKKKELRLLQQMSKEKKSLEEENIKILK